MTFNQFIFRNTVRNKKLYIAYFMSVLFSVMVFFTFSVFANHPYLLENIGNAASTGLNGAQMIIYGFAFFFVLYSMGVFLQSRKKEFGTLLIQGMSPNQLRKMVFLENFLIGLMATIVGILVGVLFASGLLLASKTVLDFDIPLYFPTGAMISTFIAFVLLFALISLLIQFRLPRLSVQELLKSADNGQGALKTSLVKTVLAVAMIGLGYVLATLASGGTVLVVFFPVLFLVVVGTYFLFNQFCVRLAIALTKRKSVFWKKTNMMVFSDLAFRMKENARSFFLVSIISTVAFASIGTLLGFRTMMRTSIDSQMDDIRYTVMQEATIDDGLVARIDEALSNNSIAYKREFSETKLVSQGDAAIEVVSASDYNRLLQAAGESPISVKEDEVVQIKLGLADKMAEKTSLEANGKIYTVRPESKQRSPFYTGVLIVGDTLYQSLSAVDGHKQWMWFTSGANDKQMVQALKFLEEEDVTNPEMQHEHSVSYKAMTSTMIMTLINPTLFVGFFIGIVFFISAGSFLYFRLYSDFDTDVQKFGMVRKIGLTNRELNKMISQQIGLLFFVPVSVALVHGFVALSAMFRAFEQPISVQSLVLLGAFAIIQIVFYVISKVVYVRKIKEAIIL